jgi:hypothetical protein
MAMGTKHISQQDHPQPMDKYQTSSQTIQNPDAYLHCKPRWISSLGAPKWPGHVNRCRHLTAIDIAKVGSEGDGDEFSLG